MSKFVNNGSRTKSAREAYVEQLPYGRGLTGYMNTKRRPFTHLKSASDVEFAYQSTPDYLRQLAQQNSPAPNEMMLARNIPRTRSASELTPRNNLNRSTVGNPKYKAQEDYYDEIQSLKKEMKSLKDENSNLRAKIRRSEEDNARKRKEIDALYDTNKDGDLRRTLSGSSTDRNNNINNPTSNVVMSLKQRVFKLELQVKQKETTIDEIKSDPRWTKGTELEIQNRALFGEIERQKVERLNYIQQNDYTATIDEEAKNAVRKLNKEKDELKKENESLKKKIQDFDKLERSEHLSARSSNDNHDKKLQRGIKDDDDDVDRLKNDLKQTELKQDQLRDKLKQANEDLEETKRDRNRLRDKLGQANENLEETKRDRDQYRKKFEQANDELKEIKRDQFSKKSEQHNDSFESKQHEHDKQLKLNQTGRSSPGLKHDEDRHRESPNLSTTRIKRPQSPTVDKQALRSSNTSLMTAAKNKPLEVQSPRSSFKADNLGNGTSRPSSANNSNEPAVKTVQASLRGYLNRTEMDKTRDHTSSPPPESRTPTRMKKFEPIKSDDEDDDDVSSKHSAPSHGSEKKRDNVYDQPKPNSKQSSTNDKTGSNNRLPLSNRDSAFKMPRSSSPSDDIPPVSSPRVGGGGGSKQNIPNERIKFGAGNRMQMNDPEPASKPRGTPSPPADRHQPSSLQTGSGGGSKQALLSDRNKSGPGSRMPINDPEPASKPRRTTSPLDDIPPVSSPHVGGGGGSKQNIPNERIKLGAGNRVQINDPKPASRLNRTPSPPDDSHRSSSPHNSSRGGAKQALPNDRNKSGPDSRAPTKDQKSATKSRSPSPHQPSRPVVPENSHPPSRKSPNNSRQSVKDTQNDDDDDDDVVGGS